MDVAARRLQHNGAAFSDQAFGDRCDCARLFGIQPKQGCDPVWIGEHPDRLSRQRHFDGGGYAVRQFVDPRHLVDDRQFLVQTVLNKNRFVRLEDHAGNGDFIGHGVDLRCDFFICICGGSGNDIWNTALGTGEILQKKNLSHSLSGSGGCGGIVSDHR